MILIILLSPSEVKQSSFPHTLPSALYGPPRNLADYSALYSASPLPPIHDAVHNNVHNNVSSVVPEVIPGKTSRLECFLKFIFEIGLKNMLIIA